jgi:hypothetical protein
VEISLPQEMPSANYSISVQLNDSTQSWFSTKTESSFLVKFERSYSGAVFWMAVHVEGSELIGVG